MRRLAKDDTVLDCPTIALANSNTMLSNETVIRTPTGDRPISALRPIDEVFDSHNHVITVNVGAEEPLQNPHRVIVRPYQHTFTYMDSYVYKRLQ